MSDEIELEAEQLQAQKMQTWKSGVKLSTIKEIFKVLIDQWPTTFKNKIKDPERSMQIWQDALCDVNDGVALRAVREIVRECEYMPGPCKFLKLCAKVKPLVLGKAAAMQKPGILDKFGVRWDFCKKSGCEKPGTCSPYPYGHSGESWCAEHARTLQ